MKPTLKYVGLDVHQATSVAAVRDGRAGCWPGVVPTEETPLLEFVGTMRGALHVAVEVSTHRHLPVLPGGECRWHRRKARGWSSQRAPADEDYWDRPGFRAGGGHHEVSMW